MVEMVKNDDIDIGIAVQVVCSFIEFVTFDTLINTLYYCI